MQARVSIHAPREGRDLDAPVEIDMGMEFQSTRPVKGATRKLAASEHERDVSIHAPREGRDVARGNAKPRTLVSIHAPREGRDDEVESLFHRELMFQSTRPVKGATRPRRPHPRPPQVSIHAPREGRDAPASASAREG